MAGIYIFIYVLTFWHIYYIILYYIYIYIYSDILSDRLSDILSGNMKFGSRRAPQHPELFGSRQCPLHLELAEEARTRISESRDPHLAAGEKWQHDLLQHGYKML
jgi:hypothetical protein